MRTVADVVVVGAGIIGASISHQLARRGLEVVAVDKAAGPAEGSTGASSSICRCRYTHPEVVRLALHGREAYANWAEYTGLESPRAELTRTGVLWMMGESITDVDAAVDRLVGQGVSAENLTASDVVERWPQLSTCAAPLDLEGDSDHVCVPGEAHLFEPDGGYVDAVGANQDLIDATRLLGGEVRFRSAVASMIRADNRITGVTLEDGDTIEADIVVNAAGPWCNRLNEMAGAELRWTLTPTRIQTVYRQIPEGFAGLPTTADGSSGIYFRTESGGQQLLVGSVVAEDEEELVDDPDSFKRSPDAEFTQMKLAALHHRLPGLEPRGMPSGIAGLYTINREDVHPVVGPTEVPGFWVANGFSGHGFKLAPAVGSLIAQAITGSRVEGDTDVPVDFLSVDRAPIDVAAKSVLA